MFISIKFRFYIKKSAMIINNKYIIKQNCVGIPIYFKSYLSR